MSIIGIYGPVSSGKLTTAKEVSEQLNYALFDNHAVNDVLAPIFRYDQPELNEERILLSRRFRYDVFESTLKTKAPVVITFNYGGLGGLNLCRKLVELSKKYNEPVYFVHLVPEKSALYERVVNPSRKNKVNATERLDELLAIEGYGYDTFPDVEHLQLDNTNLSPAQSVRAIKEYYGI